LAACSDVGRKRPNNEDSFLILDLSSQARHPKDAEVVIEPDRPGVLPALADGMGGHRSGQIASQLCTDALRQEFTRSLVASDVQVDWQKMLADAEESANQYVAQAARDNPENHRVGTTLTAVLIAQLEVTVAKVGALARTSFGREC
jgi:protein phosphatase